MNTNLYWNEFLGRKIKGYNKKDNPIKLAESVYSFLNNDRKTFSEREASLFLEEEKEKILSSGKTFIYFIQKGCGAVKIGVSNKPKERLANLQCGNHEKLKLILKIPFNSRKRAYRIESMVHRMLSRHKLSGEWYKRRVIQEFGKDSKILADTIEEGIRK